jgi:hypothetical protein
MCAAMTTIRTQCAGWVTGGGPSKLSASEHGGRQKSMRMAHVQCAAIHEYDISMAKAQLALELFAKMSCNRSLSFKDCTKPTKAMVILER